ncbi:glucoside xylosyltransferase 2 [Ascaphus truei]|uniref:glucoside xylosyltransferase 2 n=1 Tax=Ascaphus truei TaxID=8439 RepID=UPI003F59170F
MRIHCKILASLLCLGGVLLLYLFLGNADKEPPWKVTQAPHVPAPSGHGRTQPPQPGHVTALQKQKPRRDTRLQRKRSRSHVRAYEQKHRPTSPEEWMHLAVVACGDRLEETLTMLKSAVLFSVKEIQFHIFADDALKQEFENKLQEWPHPYSRKFEYKIYPITFSVGNAQEWKKLFKPCAAQRLFLPVRETPGFHKLSYYGCSCQNRSDSRCTVGCFDLGHLHSANFICTFPVSL